MERDEQEEFINSLMEPFEVDEIVLNGMVATPCKDGNRMQIYGWSEMPAKLTPAADAPAERILVLRGIMPIDAYREFILSEARRLKGSS